MKYAETQIIILTGYSEFDYAKGAIEAGVLDYLLKPINNTEFTRALLKAKEILTQQGSIKRTLDSYQSRRLVQDKDALLLKLTENIEDFNSLDFTPLTQSQIDPELGLFQTAAILIDHMDELFSTQLEKNLWKYAVGNIAQEILESSFTCFTFQDSGNHIAALAALEDSSQTSLFQSCCHQICSSVQSTLKFTVTLGVSQFFTGLRTLPDAYHSSLNALTHRFLLGNARCIFQDDLTSSATPPPHPDYVEPGDLLLNLRTANYEKAYNQAELLLSHNQSREEMIFLSVRILSDLVTCLKENSIYSSRLDLDGILKKRLSIELSVDLKQYVLDCFLEAEELLSNSVQSKPNKIVNNSIHYITQNYADNSLTLTKIAGALFINPSYLSHLFKQETGISLSEYLTKVRLKEAKQILDNHANCPLPLLAASVGYNDEYYFNKCFKKMYGMSPKKYTEKKNQKFDSQRGKTGN